MCRTKSGKVCINGVMTICNIITIYKEQLFLIVDFMFLYYILYYLYYLYYEINKIISNQKTKISDN